MDGDISCVVMLTETILLLLFGHCRICMYIRKKNPGLICALNLESMVCMT